MMITRIEEINRKKSWIYIQDEKAFVLYKGEIRQYQLKEGEDISDETYERIMKETLCKRARRRAMYLLQSMDRTQRQLEDKLRQNEYPVRAIEDAIAYVKQYGYINDEKFARAYVESRFHIKNKRQLKIDLMRKGIDSEMIQAVLENEEYQIDECELIQKWIDKKNIDIENTSRENLYKLYRFLLKKGFSHENIDKKLGFYRHNV